MMSSQISPFESMPNEVLDLIISYISTDPPSISQLDKHPSFDLVTSPTLDLKNLSLASSRFPHVVRRRLFAHACFDLGDEGEFLKFIRDWNLNRYVTSIVVMGDTCPDIEPDRFWWRRILHDLDPQRLTLLAPPLFIGEAVDTEVRGEDRWAFHMPLQILQLEQGERQWEPEGSQRQVEACSNLLTARAWSSMTFNESSFLKAYSYDVPEYSLPLLEVPSLFSCWADWNYSVFRPAGTPISLFLTQLTSFRYTAIFPFESHVELMLGAVALMTNLRSLSVQLAPCRDDLVAELQEIEYWGPADPWWDEVAAGYTLIAHAVRDLGNRAQLVQFCACDYATVVFQKELYHAWDPLDDEWAHDGNGTWTII